MTSVNQKAMKFNKRMELNFDVGDLTSNVGLLLYRKFNKVIGLIRRRLKKCTFKG
ncbi:hypothetical protein B4064_3475 [Caldibacillus thermoamylovorans]|uniref:hypothetical protein n=1 Tax=Caldibacillus thermoamylovorans TaxID=35841 RepID=UPI0005B6C501|nr:hypothetical protein [Caldibacillus thermoamylovorans]KIO60820.1 hypothetical protein B4064_3475 [Caldibacillus thermoamylovorans]